MKNILLALIFLFSCVSYTNAFGIVSDKTGTLIVTYQTDKQGERLDRIRFWIQGENFKQWLYPKKNMYVEDQPNKTRRVVIENLPEGEYSVEFLVPNTDNFFAEVPLRKVIITPGAVVKINQHINLKEDALKPIPEPEIVAITKNPGSLIISYSTLLDEISFYLKEENGKTEINSQKNGIINAIKNEGKVAILTDIPAGNYDIVFFKDGEKDQPILSEKINVEENTTTPFHFTF